LAIGAADGGKADGEESDLGGAAQMERQPGNNDDWMMVSRWATAKGVPTTYEAAREAFQPFYWGATAGPGMWQGKWLITPKLVEKWRGRGS